MKLPILIVCALAGTALAQAPGQDPYPQPPQPYPQPQPQYVPPPQQYVPIQLSRDDAELLQQGEISDNAHAGGVIANVLVGFGVGQAIQGRYGETGWIFTLGEIGGLTAMFIGFAQAISVDCDFETTCSNKGEGLLIGGLLAYLGIHVWSIVDAVTGPAAHNRKVRELKMRLGIPQPMYTRVVPYLNKSRDGGGTAGFVLRF